VLKADNIVKEVPGVHSSAPLRHGGNTQLMTMPPLPHKHKHTVQTQYTPNKAEHHHVQVLSNKVHNNNLGISDKGRKLHHAAGATQRIDLPSLAKHFQASTHHPRHEECQQ